MYRQFAGKRRSRRNSKRGSNRRSRVSNRRASNRRRSNRRSKCNRRSSRKSCNRRSKGKNKCSWVKRKSKGKNKHNAYCRNMQGGTLAWASKQMGILPPMKHNEVVRTLIHEFEERHEENLLGNQHEWQKYSEEMEILYYKILYSNIAPTMIKNKTKLTIPGAKGTVNYTDIDLEEKNSVIFALMSEWDKNSDVNYSKEFTNSEGNVKLIQDLGEVIYSYRDNEKGGTYYIVFPERATVNKDNTILSPSSLCFIEDTALLGGGTYTTFSDIEFQVYGLPNDGQTTKIPEIYSRLRNCFEKFENLLEEHYNKENGYITVNYHSEDWEGDDYTWTKTVTKEEVMYLKLVEIARCIDDIYRTLEEVIIFLAKREINLGQCEQKLKIEEDELDVKINEYIDIASKLNT